MTSLVGLCDLVASLVLILHTIMTEAKLSGHILEIRTIIFFQYLFNQRSYDLKQDFNHTGTCGVIIKDQKSNDQNSWNYQKSVR